MNKTHIDFKYKEPFNFLNKVNYETRKEEPISHISGKIIGGEVLEDNYSYAGTNKLFRIYLEEPNGDEIKLDLRATYVALYGISMLLSANPDKQVKCYTSNHSKEDGKEFTRLNFSQSGKNLPPKVKLANLPIEEAIKQIENEFIGYINKI